jgi:hypothetical protein
VSIGGSSILIIGLSSWLGKVWADRILEQDRLKYQSELEKVKSNYEKELEKYKDELDTSKALFLRYSEHQFTLYNNLWNSLCDLDLSAENLWSHTSSQNLINFSVQLFRTGKSVQYNRLLIEAEHFNQLHKILNEFRNFQIGKITLIDLRKETPQTIEELARNIVANEQIQKNKATKQRYNLLLEEIAKSFKKQIAGK